MNEKERAIQHLSRVRDILRAHYDEGNKTKKMRKVHVGELWMLYDILCKIFQEEDEVD